MTSSTQVPKSRVLSSNPLPAGNTATGWLKIIALAFMLTDHIGVAVFPNIQQLRILGRAAFPIYCWCMVVGFHYTRSVPRYLVRIIIVGLLSQPIYARVLNHMPPAGASVGIWIMIMGNKFNIFLTLLLGLLGLWSLREKWFYSQFWGPVMVLCLASLLKVDYDWKGVLFIMLLYAARTSRPSIAALMVAFFLFWGSNYSVSLLFPLPGGMSVSSLPAFLSNPLTAFLKLETWGLLSLPFILIRFRRNLKLPVVAGYLLYPAHLLLIWGLKLLLVR